MTTKSSQLLHLDPLAIALEKRRQQEEQSQTGEDNSKDSSRPKVSSQPNTDNLLNMSSQPKVSSQLTEQPAGGPVSNQPILSRQANMGSQPNTDNQFPTKPLNLLASIPDIKGDARVPHRYSDYLCRLLKADEQAVYWQLYRLSWGWGQETCFISNPKLSERSNVPLSSMKRAVAGLVSKGLIEKTGQANGYGKDQGVEYKVFTLGWQPNTGSQPNVAPIKKEKQKENIQRREVTQEEIQEQANEIAERIRGGTSLEEIERDMANAYRPSQWVMIRSIAIAQAGSKQN